jgi:hypothetical protein
VAAALALISLVAVVRISATHRVFAATADEAQHIAAGVDWLRDSFAFAPEQQLTHVTGTPLARIAVGLGPTLAGVRDTRMRDVLYDGPGYERNLVLGRRGTLPFLVLLIFGTFWLGRRLFGDAVGLVAAAAVSTVPAVLGHAGLATTDVAGASTAVLALIALLRWLEAPTLRRAVVFGLALGVAFATKLSALTLLPAAAVVALYRRRATGTALPVSRTALAGSFALAAVAFCLVTWSALRFSFARPDEQVAPATLHNLIDTCTTHDTPRRILTAVLGLRMPAPEIPNGLLFLCATNRPGQSTTYLLGRLTQDGFPLFFPLALAVKTPLPFLVLALLGLRAAGRDEPGSDPAQRWPRLAPALVAATTLALVLPSRLQIGIRHILMVYPLLAVYVGVGVVDLWRTSRTWSRPAVVALAAWQLAIPVFAAPDYLPWFNALAGRHPENVLLDSDLDWGQDLLRLERALAEHGVQRFSVAYFGPSDLCRQPMPMPLGRWLRPHEPVTGIVAISEMYRKGVIGHFYRNGDYCDRTQWTNDAPPDPTAYAWLDAYQPIARIGTSILLYDIPADGGARGP